MAISRSAEESWSITAQTDDGLSAALDCCADAFEELQDEFMSGLRDGSWDSAAERNYLRDAAWAGSQWH